MYIIPYLAGNDCSVTRLIQIYGDKTLHLLTLCDYYRPPYWSAEDSNLLTL